MSIRDYLKGLDLEQLRHAIEVAEGLIADKEAEDKVLLWVVSNEAMNLEFFSDADYLKAAEYLLEEAKENAELRLKQPVSVDLMALCLRRVRMRVSEAKEYVTVTEDGTTEPLQNLPEAPTKEEGMTIAGDGASLLGQLLAEQGKNRAEPVPHA